MPIPEQKFPGVFSQATSAYLCLTGCRGKADIQLRYVDLTDGRILLSSPKITIESADPLSTQEVAIQIPPIPMPHQGLYALEAYCNDEMIGSIRIKVDQGPPTKGGASDDKKSQQ